MSFCFCTQYLVPGAWQQVFGVSKQRSIASYQYDVCQRRNIRLGGHYRIGHREGSIQVLFDVCAASIGAHLLGLLLESRHVHHADGRGARDVVHRGERGIESSRGGGVKSNRSNLRQANLSMSTGVVCKSCRARGLLTIIGGSRSGSLVVSVADALIKSEGDERV